MNNPESNSIKESVVFAMDGTDTGLYPFLPYIMQDIWEFGASPEVVISLIKKLFGQTASLRLLDLGCGKGPVSVKAARSLGCRCHGVDAVPEFIAEAKHKAKEFGVDHLCTFETGDIREAVSNCRGYDVVVLGAIGPVLGTMYETLQTVVPCLSRQGVVVVDDGYTIDKQNDALSSVSNLGDLLLQIEAAGMQLLDNEIMQPDMIRVSNREIFGKMKQRCLQLAESQPDQRSLFLDYLAMQQVENEVLENKIVCATLVIGRRT